MASFPVDRVHSSLQFILLKICLRIWELPC